MSFCIECGFQLIQQSRFCAGCGTQTANPTARPALREFSDETGAAPDSEPTGAHVFTRQTEAASGIAYQGSITTEQALELFVGKRYQYYAKQWATIDSNNLSGKAFNWVAFLFMPFWLAYRKMYFFFALNVIFITMVAIAIFILERQIGEQPSRSYFGLSIGLGAAYGFFADWLYWKHATKQVKEILTTTAPAYVEQKLAIAGGVSIAAMLASIVIFVAEQVALAVALYG